MAGMAGNASAGPGSVASASAIPLDRSQLIAAWTTAYGRLPPLSLSTRLLALAAAYHDQVQVYGGLKPAMRRALLAMARDGDRPKATGPKRASKHKAPAGTRLVRDWHGKTHIVDILERGILYQGQTYRSLSEVARAITGARWSGPRFFGL